MKSSSLTSVTVPRKAHTRRDGIRVSATKTTVRKNLAPATSEVNGPKAGPATVPAKPMNALGTGSRAEPESSAAPLADLVDNDFAGWDADLEHNGYAYVYRSGFELNRRTGKLKGFTEHESVNTWTFDEAFGHVMKFHFGSPRRASDMDDLVRESMTDLGALVQSHEEEWDGNNFRATFSSEADSAVERIEARLSVEEDVERLQEYAIEAAEALSSLIDDQDVPEGVTVGWDWESEDERQYTDDRTGQSVSVSFEYGGAGDVGAQFSRFMDELADAVEAHDAAAAAELADNEEWEREQEASSAS